jgi:hypothetical protein
MVERIIIVLVAALLAIGCEPEDECPGSDLPITSPINESSRHWFQELGKPLAYGSSSMGRTVSYDMRYFGGAISFNERIDDCTKIERERRTVSYTSSLYNFNYNLTVRNQPDNDVLHISTRPYYSYENYSYYLDGTAHPGLNDYEIDLPALTSARLKIPGSEKTIPLIRLDSLLVKNTLYYGVYKMDVQEKKYSIDDKSQVFYFTPKQGLLRVDMLDGEIWELH